ncbi:S-layer homology domain-containing protein [Spirulina sp. 06S082]|uniref:S-layer homology domain-containing protein n=1 Tax=Spirulina sp. 06S082 TaxID=3110248 RepID=UPI002B1F1F8A|nr:S-layer homology domain-containing protein [Spirulina sp. 06S082]MEA5471768.1 S-layer homology domain-containing protein [Spirulina sp. 06S082]
MLNLKRLKATAALMLALATPLTGAASITASIIAAAPAQAQGSRFGDVPDSHWAEDFITALVDRGVIAGFPDGSFKPEAPVTRAQFSSLLKGAFNKGKTRSAINFVDVASNHWAMSAIDNAYETGFLSGYPGSIFRPEQNIPREQVLVSLANGLNYSANAPVNEVLGYYNDGGNISNFARSPIAAATEEKIVVNYPTVTSLNPNRNATRAEVAAFLYQALVREGNAPAIASGYIVSLDPVATQFKIPAGTSIPVTYTRDKILLLPDETLPITFDLKTNITTQNGKVLIPADSKVKGQLVPAGSGTKFVAEQLIYPDGTTQSVNAVSQIITKTETVNKGSDLTRIVRNSAIGTAAAAAISAVTGDRAIATEELLIGAGAGAIAGLIQNFLGRNSVDLIVVEPETDLDITLGSDLLVSTR